MNVIKANQINWGWQGFDYLTPPAEPNSIWNGTAPTVEYRVEWSSTSIYVAGDIVIRLGRQWLAVTPSAGVVPSSPAWIDQDPKSYTTVPNDPPSSTKTYQAGYKVVSGGVVFRSKQSGNLNHSLLDVEWWEPQSPGLYTELIRTSGLAVYSAGTIYPLGQRAYLKDSSGNPIVWESLAENNLANDPLSSPTKWLNAGSANFAAMFNGVVSSQTVDAAQISVGMILVEGNVSTASVDSVCLHNISASEITATVYSIDYTVSSRPLTQVYTRTVTGLTGKPDVAFIDLPSTYRGYLSVNIKKLDGDGIARVGEIVTGERFNLGKDQYGIRVSIIDYSSKNTDDYGNTSVTKRAFAKKLTTTLILDPALMDATVNKLASVRSTPCAWVADNGFTSGIVYGFFKSFDTTQAGPRLASCALEIEGMI